MNEWPRDEDFGIRGYHYYGSPLGGEIKVTPADFKVVEVDPVTNRPIPQPPVKIEYPFEDGGLYLIGRVWRQDNDHGRMIRLLSKIFGVPEDHISTAGIKDAKAEIVQLFSIYDPKKEVKDPLIVDVGMEIDSFQFTREKMYPGRMGGNYFEINIHNCNIVDDHEFDFFGALAGEGLLNYYGYQRFGSGRPITAHLGRALARKDYETAVNIYLGGESSLDDEVYRKHWRDHRDPDELLLIWDDIPNTEKKMLIHLSKRNKDYRGAASKFPEFLVNIAKSAFVSLLTNEYMSIRGYAKELLKGERELNDNIQIAQPSNRWPHPLNDIWKQVFNKYDVDLKKDLKQMRHTERWLFLKIRNWSARYLTDDKVQVSFQLENGQYATTVLRELMQSPPSAYY